MDQINLTHGNLQTCMALALEWRYSSVTSFRRIRAWSIEIATSPLDCWNHLLRLSMGANLFTLFVRTIVSSSENCSSS